MDSTDAEALPDAKDGQLWSVELTDTARALRYLPAEQRDALILVGAAGFSYKEAAQICGCELGTVKSRVARARVALAKAMDGLENIQMDPRQDTMGDADELSSQIDKVVRAGVSPSSKRGGNGEETTRK
jgi:RNA polymerase sigma-70 factor (ECF subfamily)